MSLALDVSALCVDLNHPSFDLQVEAGSLTVVLGPTGNGKGKCLQTLAGILPANTGEVLLFGNDPYAGDEKTWLIQRKKIGYVLPSRTLVSHLTVLQNIMLPLSYHRFAEPDEIEEIAQQMAEWLGVEDDVNQLPAEFAEQERRFITLARALVLKPKILFVEQAFAHLDVRMRERFVAAYSKIINHGETTLVLATKDWLGAASVASAVSVPQQYLFAADSGIQSFGSWQQLETSDDTQIRQYAELHYKVEHANSKQSL